MCSKAKCTVSQRLNHLTLSFLNMTMTSLSSDILHSHRIRIPSSLMCSRQICSNFVMVSCQYRPKSLRDASTTLLNLCYEELRQCWRQKGVQPGASKVYPINWPHIDCFLFFVLLWYIKKHLLASIVLNLFFPFLVGGLPGFLCFPFISNLAFVLILLRHQHWITTDFTGTRDRENHFPFNGNVVFFLLCLKCWWDT